MLKKKKNLPANAGDMGSIPGLKDPTCHEATKPVRHNYGACTLEPAIHNYWALVPQLLKLTCPGAHTPQLLSPRAAPTEAHAPRACAPQ